MVLLISAPLIFVKSYRDTNFSHAIPASPYIYMTKLFLSLFIALLYALLVIISIFTSPSVLLVIECIGYCIICLIAARIASKEYKIKGQNSSLIKLF